MRQFILIILLFLVSACKSSYKQVESTEIDEKRDKTETRNYDLAKLDKLISDIKINKDQKLDFIVYDTSKPLIEGKPPILIEGVIIDKSTITDNSLSEELTADKSNEIIEDKGQINIRDKLQVEDKKNNKSIIEQITRLGFIVVLLAVTAIYIKRKWF